MDTKVTILLLQVRHYRSFLLLLTDGSPVAAMKSLSEHIIHGAEFDSSIRDPPPRCHPGTRVELNDKINQWFNDEGRQKALLWLNGPAGVGKSAVTQTFAEFLATSKRLGASLFFSKHNRRRDPQKVFITVAFQLAVRVPSYRIYVAEQIALDPSLLKKGLKEQFRILIAEPFGNGGFGNEVKPLGILLDGLDECEGVDQQCEIVQLVSEFVLNFPQAPLVWVIASRPEPHITATFRDEIVIPSHWSEYMPIDSTEACQDVERYLRASFKSIRKRFSYISSKWPSETQFLKLSHGASGLFVFATVAVRFIGNADYADPVSRLKLILTVIDRVKVIVTDDHPFALLDAVYTEILVSIPDPLLLITKRILGFFLCAQGVYPSDVPTVSLKSRNLVAASIILDLEQSVVYASLHKLYSVLRIPRPGNAHKHGVSFLHTSFADYLTDPIRSKELFVDVGESADNIIHHLCEIYTQKPWDNKSNQRAHQLSRKKKKNLYQNLKHDAGIALTYHVIGDLKSARGRGPFLSQQDRSECLEILSQIDIAELYANDYRPQKLIEWLFKLWQVRIYRHIQCYRRTF